MLNKIPILNLNSFMENNLIADTLHLKNQVLLI